MAADVQGSSRLSAANIQATIDEMRQRYEQEKNKRLRDDGEAQFIDIRKSSTWRHYLDDPWIRSDVSKDPSLKSGNRCKYLVVGIGFAGILDAVRLIESGIDVEDIRLIDKADGFGGTWYWNRFPGACCDVEAHVYLPLLEETGYMPSHKYAPGHEIIKLCEMIATKYGLRERTFFRRNVQSMIWDESNKEWIVTAEPEGKSDGKAPVEIRAQFALLGIGLADRPKLTDLPGIETFKGKALHSSRWDYGYTGGTQVDPAMTNLRDKTVGVIGTGCSGIQVVPELAKYAKHLYVFQRTPSAVTQRTNAPTDPREFQKKVASGPGWQQARRDNYAAFCHGMHPEVDLVNDEISKWPTAYGLGGYYQPVNMEGTASHLQKLEKEDIVYTETIRDSVDSIVKDPETAQKLKSYYNSWCKRPTWHGGYLQAFNLPNVTLVDTDGKGVDRITAQGVAANGQEYRVDMLVYSTGYKVGIGGWDPAARADMKVIGRNGLDMNEVWGKGASTLHGIAAHGFPNMFWNGMAQAGVTPNQTYTIDIAAKHFAYILTHLPKTDKVTIEATHEACEAWVERYLATGPSMMHAFGCTPNYYNQEGDLQRQAAKGPETMNVLARSGIWGTGAVNYKNILLDWEKEGKLEGFQIESPA